VARPGPRHRPPRARCDVAIHYHGSRAGAEDTARQVRAAGRRAHILHADLRDAVRARQLGPEAAEALGGRLDILVNSAAIMVRQPLAEITPESWDETMDVNLRAAFFVVQGAAGALQAASGGGRIVNIADLAGLEPWRHYIQHCVSKAGLVMLTRTLAAALAPGVTVNAVAPGAVLLPDDWNDAARDHLVVSTPLQRLGAPTDVLGAVLYLLENDYVTGTVLVVDGGRLIR
jgi:NAD(P)-dependent dehydrogenase (short-subunit alcohol dehydrogenase family)